MRTWVRWEILGTCIETHRPAEIKINPVLEGEKGRERLALQSTFKGDDRFKLGADFMEEDEQQGERGGDEIAKELGAEKDQSMDILKSMFGDQGAVRKYVKTKKITYKLMRAMIGNQKRNGQAGLDSIRMQKMLPSICYKQKRPRFLTPKVKMRVKKKRNTRKKRQYVSESIAIRISQKS